MVKRCRHCRSVKPLDAFPSDLRRPDGRIDFCRRCWSGNKGQLAARTTRNEAISRLIERHRSEFDDLVAQAEREARAAS